MLYAEVHTHPASECPIITTDGKKMLKQLFSEENIKKSGVTLTSANMSCPTDKSVYPKGFFYRGGKGRSDSLELLRPHDGRFERSKASE